MKKKKHFTLGGATIKEGDYISLDGSTGNIYNEDIPTVDPEISWRLCYIYEMGR